MQKISSFDDPIMIYTYINDNALHHQTCSFPLSHAATAIIPVYMVKEDGRNAVDAMNIPLLGAKNSRVRRATFDPYLLLMALDFKRAIMLA